MSGAGRSGRHAEHLPALVAAGGFLTACTRGVRPADPARREREAMIHAGAALAGAAEGGARR